MSDNGKALAIVPTDIDGFGALAARFAKSALIPDALRNKEADVFVTLLAGHELGLPPMAALRGIHVISGKPILTADTMVALVLSSGACEYFILVEGDDESATYETKRVGAPHSSRQTWTMSDAKRASLLSNANWTKNPRAMLRARAKSILARDVYPDVLAGCYEEGEAAEISGEPTVTVGPLPGMKRADAHVVEPAASAKPVDAAPPFDFALAIATAKTVEALASVGARIKAECPEAERARLKPSYEARLTVLNGPDPFAAFLADLSNAIGRDVTGWTADDLGMEFIEAMGKASTIDEVNAVTLPWLNAASKPGRGPAVRAVRAGIEKAASERRAELGGSERAA